MSLWDTFNFWESESSDEPAGFVTADMMDLNERLSPNYFVRDLTVTNTGIYNAPPRSAQATLQKMALMLEKIEARIGPFVIASAYRSTQVNNAVGGSPTSRHLAGDAVDISPTTMTAEKFWGAILLDDELSSQLGHIAWKKHQNNAIHITLPFTRSSGEYIRDVPQVADKIAGSIQYISASPTQIQTAKNKFLGVVPSTEVVVAGFQFNPIYWGLAATAATTLILTMLKRK